MPPAERAIGGQEAVMGLDLLELVLAVEDAFGCSIADEDAAELNTLGKLYEYILAHRFQADEEGCLTSIVFYKIRRAMMVVLQVPRKNVRVATRLSALIPRRRRHAWHAIHKASGLRLPRLRRPVWVTAVATLASLVPAVAAPLLLGLRPLNGAIWLAVLVGTAAGYFFYWLTIPLAFEFQLECHTVGELTIATLARNFQAVHDEAKSSNTAEVWDVLCRIVSEQLGVGAGDLTKETSFFQDR
jgi:acyl carrier protein